MSEGDTSHDSVRVYADGEALGLNLKDVERLCRARALELLRAIVREQPGSMRETARTVDRDVNAVHGDLRALEQMGVLELKRDGRARRPAIPYDDLHIEVDLTE